MRLCVKVNEEKAEQGFAVYLRLSRLHSGFTIASQVGCMHHGPLVEGP